ncbi:plasminogen activator inhibitor 1 RNA-binding protein-like [Wyeomyia smithii]|uniref:plasminogen activator inhibitor 1 RNA-binding protein-like n=1 Tax=Wyeomyia smithii TaxID=174621 RepID=UPI002467D3AC|nr:plasminogen activator inhibitor 1 RNA-binding protein-like [Wyeomyia smithii]XP_055549350.1 plasminogen activator inhibitor 1 RNA-binding protein-like [Wyeomyia smithii]
MENTSYGINVANRYDLFSIDDEGDDPFTTVTQIKKTPKKHLSGGDQLLKTVSRIAEKENKTAQIKINNENKHPEKQVAGGNNSTINPRGEKHAIKETQKDNIRLARDDGNKYHTGKSLERRQINKPNLPGSESRDEKNKKNRDSDENNQRKFQTGKRYELRGKREFDRQSGSNKTGVKSIEKREGTGSHNWGSAKADAKEFNNFQDVFSQEIEEDKGTMFEQGKDENINDGQEVKLPIEEELKEMTLDEWKAQIAANRSKPQYNLRKAGEGEDAKQWDKMVALDKKKADVEADEENEIQKVGRSKQVLDIEFHFNDGRRGGLMGRPRGRGGRGTRNAGKRENDKKDVIDIREGDTEKRERRSRLTTSTDTNFGNYKMTKQSTRFNKNTAPKVDDEHDFPSLG